MVCSDSGILSDVIEQLAYPLYELLSAGDSRIDQFAAFLAICMLNY